MIKRLRIGIDQSAEHLRMKSPGAFWLAGAGLREMLGYIVCGREESQEES